MTGHQGTAQGGGAAEGQPLDRLVQSHVQLLRLTSQRPFDQAVAHRVRTLLKQAADLQGTTGLSPEQRDFLGRIRSRWENYLKENGT